MGESVPRYGTKTIHTVRGLEGRTLSKMEQDGWELVERAEAPMLRSKLTFRRQRKPLPRWAWIVGGTAAAAIVTAIVVGSITEGDSAPAPTAATTAAAATTPSVTPTRTTPPTPSPSSSTLDPAVTTPVTDAEVLAAFNDYFRERAATGVVLGKAVTNVTYAGRVVTVTFSPAAAGVSQQVFDSGNPFPNLAKFVATPIAFNDDLGNRIRPAVDTIQTIRDDGVSLGSYSHAEILALNELSE